MMDASSEIFSISKFSIIFNGLVPVSILLSNISLAMVLFNAFTSTNFAISAT